MLGVSRWLVLSTRWTSLEAVSKVKGRKRHIVVDVLGLILSCFVSAANVADVKELIEHHESFVHIAMIRLMLRKLTRNQRPR